VARIITLKAKKAGLLPVDWEAICKLAVAPHGLYSFDIPKGSRRRMGRLGIATTKDPGRSVWVLTAAGVEVWQG